MQQVQLKQRDAFEEALSQNVGVGGRGWRKEGKSALKRVEKGEKVRRNQKHPTEEKVNK